MSLKPIRLTQTVQKGGCAAKVAAIELKNILSQVRFPVSPPELLIDSGTFDDAAIYSITPELALVQTLDFFTPILDSPRSFGQVAAANALSDVYAMGGTPKTAMAILAFPLGEMESSVIVEVLQGACDVIARSGAALVGGHTIDDESLKFGLAVTGFVDPKKVWSNSSAQPGDILILTKPLGTGALTAALKRGEVVEMQIQDAIDSMCLLNDIQALLTPSEISAIHAATDITGFGLGGHALNMARASHVSLKIHVSNLPLFAHTLDFLERGFLTKAHRTNAEYIKAETQMAKLSSSQQNLICDPQTSGGLLIAVEAKSAAPIIAKLSKQFPSTCQIGEVEPPGDSALNFL